MDKNQLKYKLFKSFRIPLTSEDRITGKMHANSGELVNITIFVDELNYDFLTFSTSEKIPYELVELELSRSARIFGKEKIQLQGHIILSKRSKDHSKHKYQYTVAIEDNENYKQWVKDFISQFSKKRLHSYLLASATRMKNLDFEDMSETICLLIDSFNTISDGHDDLKITDYLHTCRDLIGCESARIWLYDVSDNTLSCQYSTNPEESKLKQDFRKGIPGKVFNNGEIVNVYNSPLLENETTSILAGPISNRFHKVIGVIEFEEKENDTRFDLDDESMIRTLTVCFSSHFQMFNPVNSASKIKLFNPGLKSNFLNLLELNNDQTTLHLIQKLRSNNENIMINHSSAEALQIIVEELVQGSNYHDRKVVHFNANSNTVDLKNLTNSIVILDKVEEYSKDMQDEIVDIIGTDTTWVISTCHKDDISKTTFTEKFWTKFAKHHVNMQRNQSNEAPQEAFIKLANSVQHLSSFDEKVSYLTESLGLNSQKNKQAA
ncbi:MAG: GAF domain-containing protein [Deltaproteobacteria bacterium]|nr:MAG: GAF domain-containing protein [Deltaproteobacteria bacterium]